MYNILVFMEIFHDLYFEEKGDTRTLSYLPIHLFFHFI